MHVGILPNYWKYYSSTRTNMFEINPPTTVCYGGPGGTHTRPKYWRKISWKISRLSPKLRNFMSATSPVRETWRQILCLRLHPMAQKGHQRLKYWCQISWKNIHDLSPSISCLRQIFRLSPVAKFYVKFHVCDFPSVTKFALNIFPVS